MAVSRFLILNQTTPVERRHSAFSTTGVEMILPGQPDVWQLLVAQIHVASMMPVF
jgi:hypothetical protein